MPTYLVIVILRSFLGNNLNNFLFLNETLIRSCLNLEKNLSVLRLQPCLRFLQTHVLTSLSAQALGLISTEALTLRIPTPPKAFAP